MVNYSKHELAKFPFRDATLDVQSRVEDLLGRLTLDEKFRLMSGYAMWWTPAIKRLNIPKMGMSDGPRGISYHSSMRKCTQYPVPKTLASTWDRTLSQKFGDAIAKEIRAIGKHILLAPGINIDRTPLNGRTFEYFSEDPLLIREMVVPLVKAVQNQNIGACVKHYAANNQETNRRNISAEIDERTLREIYLKSFEQIVKEADPWSIMSCYNRVNGEYGSASKTLLQNYLVNEFGFSGFIMTDWGATDNLNNPEEGIHAGLTLEMPKKKIYTPKKLHEALKHGKITLKRVDELVGRLITVMIKTKVLDKPKIKEKINLRHHHQIARAIAVEGMVLLKNENNTLPLKKSELKSIAIVGANANKKFGKFIYGGSAAVIPPFEITPLKGIKKYLGKSVKIVKNPAEADITLVITGLNHDKGSDGESGDKIRLGIPPKEEDLILHTVSQNPNTVVVLISGSPVSMDKWKDKVPAILEAWYPGMMGGLALADILFGEVNPSGKLPISFPKTLADSPAHQSARSYPGEGRVFKETFIDALNIGKGRDESVWKDNKVYYDEGIYVGYRHFDTKNVEPLFEFGFGLSYTQFEITHFVVDQQSLHADSTFTLAVDVTNIGNYDGAEVVQVYYSDVESSVDRPLKELLGFQKVFVKKGETERVEIVLRASDLAFFDVDSKSWKVEAGDFKILVGNSSRNIIHETSVTVNSIS